MNTDFFRRPPRGVFAAGLRPAMRGDVIGITSAASSLHALVIPISRHLPPRESAAREDAAKAAALFSVFASVGQSIR
jgi:hypothetical protein